MTIYVVKQYLRNLLSISIGKKGAIIDALIPFYQELANWSMSLQPMGLYLEDVAVLVTMVQFINSKEKVHLILSEISEECLRQRIDELEKYIQN